MDAKRIRNSMTESVHNGRLHSTAAFLFYLAVIVINQASGVLVTSFYYFAVVFACYWGLFPDGKRMELPRAISGFGILVALTGVINIVFVGNSTVNKQLYTLLSIGMALLFLNQKVDSGAFLLALLINAAIVLVRVMMDGPRGQIYISSTVNYVSVNLIYPMVLYYAVRESRKKKLIIWPAVLVWVLCLVVQGRAGILFCSFFLFGLLFYIFCGRMKKAAKRTRIIWCCGVVLAIVAVIGLGVAFDVVHRVEIFARFAEYGLTGNGRGPIWMEYLTASVSSLKSFVLAPDLTTLVRAMHHDGNLHNSFMNVHAYNGIVMLAVVVAMCCWAVWYGVRNGRWIYLICFATFSMRGATDYVFWGSTGTPILLYFLFLPIVEQYKAGGFVLSLPGIWARIRAKVLKK